MNTLRLEEVTPKEMPKPSSGRPAVIQAAATGRTASGSVRYVLLAIAAIYVIVSLCLMISTRSHLSSFERTQQSFNDRMSARQATAETKLKTSAEAMTNRLEVTQQQLQQRMQARATDLQRRQILFDRRLQEQQKNQAEQKQQIGQVSGDVANVRGELGTAKTDIAATRADLETTKIKLDRAVGDLTGQSSLIARTREELEELKHRGDRNYYEFSLSKGGRPLAVSTVSLQLRKTNAKKNKFTLNVIADDRTIEKKDRGVAEPLQFYTGRDRALYEIVVWSVDKNGVTGYLSTPRSVGTSVANR